MPMNNVIFLKRKANIFKLDNIQAFTNILNHRSYTVDTLYGTYVLHDRFFFSARIKRKTLSLLKTALVCFYMHYCVVNAYTCTKMHLHAFS